MSDQITEPGDAEMLAGEYVLGVLDAAARRAVAAQALTDPALAADIALWERQLAPLALLVTPIDPPAALWPRIGQSLDARTLGRSADRPALAARQLRLWRGATAASLALAAALAVVAFLPRNAPEPLPGGVTLAALAPLGGPAPAFIVRSLSDGRLQVAALGTIALPTGRDLELWALPQGAAKPVSLGVLPVGGKYLTASALTAPGGKLLVSLEPKGGSPTGQPTGAVLYGGTITQL